MFGFSFEEKMRKAMVEYFSHKPSPIFDPIVKKIAQHAKETNLNEFDAACLYLLTALDALEPDDAATGFILHICNRMERSRYKSRHGNELISQLEEIIAKHNIVREPVVFEPDPPGILVNRWSVPSATYKKLESEDDIEIIIDDSFKTFEDWYKVFVIYSGIFNETLKPDENGGSLVDFIDHGPLRKAFRDRVSPRQVAEAFATTFDVEKFFRIENLHKRK